MKKAIVFLFFVVSYPGFGQLKNQGHIFFDTSLYFIQQLDSINPVQLSPAELALAEKILLQALEDFNVFERRYTDSVNIKKKKNKRRALQLDSKDYYFRLTPHINEENQKEVWINGDCKSWFISWKTKRPVFDKQWKKNFIDRNNVYDGGSCFIYVHINLVFKTYIRLGMNARG